MHSLGSDKFLLLGVFLSLTLTNPDLFGQSPYFILLLGSSVSVFLRVLEKKQLFTKQDNGSNAWKFVVFSWFIGVVIGVYNGNEPRFIFRNFLGLVFYFLVPVFLFVRPSLKSIYWILMLGALVQIAQALYSFDAYMLNLFLSGIDANSISDFRSAYSIGFVVIFPIIALAIAKTVVPRLKTTAEFPLLTKFSSLPILVLGLFSTVVVTASKGFMLAVFLIVCAIVASSALSIKNSITTRLAAVAGVMTIVLLVYTLTSIDLYQLVVDSFSTKDLGNQIRSDQAEYLIAEFSFFGSGLGATLKSGYARDIDGYGFELTYLNLIHKLGVFSVPIFFLYLSTLKSSIGPIFFGHADERQVLALGLMGYLIVGIGNPILLSSTCVTLHCIAIYMLNGRFENASQVIHRKKQWR